MSAGATGGWVASRLACVRAVRQTPPVLPACREGAARRMVDQQVRVLPSVEKHLPVGLSSWTSVLRAPEGREGKETG